MKEIFLEILKKRVNRLKNELLYIERKSKDSNPFYFESTLYKSNESVVSELESIIEEIENT